MKEELNALEIQRIQSEIDKNLADKKRLDAETEQIHTALNTSFFKKTEFLRVLVAGVSISFVLAAYVHYAFIPAQNSLEQKFEHATFSQLKDKALFEIKNRALTYEQERIENKTKLAEISLQKAETNLIQANADVKEINSIIFNIQEMIAKGEKFDDSKFRDIKISLTATQTSINQASESVALEKDSLSNLLKDKISREVKKVRQGWIYVGYKPSNWDYRNLRLSDEQELMVSASTEAPKAVYDVQNTVNLRKSPPKFSIFGYDYGEAVGYIEKGSKVILLDTREVGFSKVWAKAIVIESN
jgi:hypothetical protein